MLLDLAARARCYSASLHCKVQVLPCWSTSKVACVCQLCSVPAACRTCFFFFFSFIVHGINAFFHTVDASATTLMQALVCIYGRCFCWQRGMLLATVMLPIRGQPRYAGQHCFEIWALLLMATSLQEEQLPSQTLETYLLTMLPMYVHPQHRYTAFSLCNSVYMMYAPHK